MSENRSTITRLFKDLSLYTLEPIVFKLISFILIPIYTGFLLPAEYGILQFIISMGTFLRSITQMGLNTGFWKTKNELPESELKNLSFTVLFTQLLIGFIILFLLVGTVSLGNKGIVGYGLIAYFIALLIKLVSESYLLMCRAIHKPKLYLLISLSQSIILFLLNILFITKFHLGIFGAITGYVTAFSISSLIYFPIMRKEVFGKFSIKLSKELLVFGAPLLIGNLSILLLSISDRWFLKWLSTGEQLGLYGYGYKFSDLIATFIVYTFQLAWTPIAWKIFTTEDGKRLYHKMENLVVVLFPVLTFIFIPPILALVYIMTKNPSYYDGLKIIFLISFSHVFYGFYSFNSTKNFYYNKKKNVIIANIIAAALNFILNILLIPTWGMMGAAYATIISYIGMFIIIEMVKIEELREYKSIKWKQYVFLIVAVSLVLVCTQLFDHSFSWFVISMFSFLCAISLVSLNFILGIFAWADIVKFKKGYLTLRKPAKAPPITNQSDSNEG